MQLRLVWYLLCTLVWPQIHSNPPASFGLPSTRIINVDYHFWFIPKYKSKIKQLKQTKCERGLSVTFSHTQRMGFITFTLITSFSHSLDSVFLIVIFYFHFFFIQILYMREKYVILIFSKMKIMNFILLLKISGFFFFTAGEYPIVHIYQFHFSFSDRPSLNGLP